jgi:hypothetical protein
MTAAKGSTMDADFALRLDLSRIGARLHECASLLERQVDSAEVAKLLRELAEEADQLRPPLRLSSYLQKRGI